MTGNVVYQDRVVWRKNYGLKDKNNKGNPPGQDTVFRVASITKIFTVSIISFLDSDGHIFVQFLSLSLNCEALTQISIFSRHVEVIQLTGQPSNIGRYATRWMERMRLVFFPTRTFHFFKLCGRRVK